MPAKGQHVDVALTWPGTSTYTKARSAAINVRDIFTATLLATVDVTKTRTVDAGGAESSGTRRDNGGAALR
jgi:hypothetical protein